MNGARVVNVFWKLANRLVVRSVVQQSGKCGLRYLCFSAEWTVHEGNAVVGRVADVLWVPLFTNYRLTTLAISISR